MTATLPQCISKAWHMFQSCSWPNFFFNQHCVANQLLPWLTSRILTENASCRQRSIPRYRTGSWLSWDVNFKVCKNEVWKHIMMPTHVKRIGNCTRWCFSAWHWWLCCWGFTKSVCTYKILASCFSSGQLLQLAAVPLCVWLCHNKLALIAAKKKIISKSAHLEVKWKLHKPRNARE